MMNEMSFSIDFKNFSDFSFKRDRRMDGRTEPQRGAMAHLGIGLSNGSRDRSRDRYKQWF